MGSIENHIAEVLTGDDQTNALSFVTFLQEQGVQFERGTGYWADHFYLMLKYRDEYVCFILLGDSEGTDFPWTIWSDNYNSTLFADFPLDERTKEIAWNNVDYCAKCGSCNGGIRKTIFGKEFNNVCTTTFRFDNPDAEAVECMKKLVRMRIENYHNLK